MLTRPLSIHVPPPPPPPPHTHTHTTTTTTQNQHPMQVTVSFIGRQLTDNIEDDEYLPARDLFGEPYTFTLGANDMIKGWDDAVASMRQGELADFRFGRRQWRQHAGNLNPGHAGYGAGVPLRFEIELMRWEDTRTAPFVPRHLAYLTHLFCWMGWFHSKVSYCIQTA